MLTFKNWLNNYFGFTKREYNGLLSLVVILLLVSVLPYFWSFSFSDEGSITTGERLALQKLILVDEQEPDHYTKTRAIIEDGIAKPIKFFKFDPNQVDAVTWQQFGLSAKQAQAIINYRNKGGKFYKPEDLKKMYTIKPEKYKELEPYIEIEEIQHAKFSRTFEVKTPYQKKEAAIIEINSADTLQFDELKGIGATFARRIVKYRTQLGGFYKKEQLMEVFGIDSLTFKEVKDQLKVDLLGIIKININTVEFNELKNHPYLKYKQINSIIQYRKQHGKYNSIDDLKKVAILTPQNIQNLAPYLTF